MFIIKLEPCVKLLRVEVCPVVAPIIDYHTSKDISCRIHSISTQSCTYLVNAAEIKFWYEKAKELFDLVASKVDVWVRILKS